MSGVIHIDRDLLNHPIVGISRPRHMAAWIWMLSEARWKDGFFDSFGKTIEVKRGQFVASRKRLSDKTGLSEKEIRTFLVRLEREGMVSKTGQVRGQAPMLITICKYDDFQDLENYRTKQKASEGPARGQRGANKRNRDKPDKPEDTTLIAPEFLENRLREAAGLQNEISPALFDVSSPLNWLSSGCHLDLDIIPTLKAKSHSKVRTWGYFSEAVFEARDRRLQPAPEIVQFRNSNQSTRPQSVASLAMQRVRNGHE